MQFINAFWISKAEAGSISRRSEIIIRILIKGGTMSCAGILLKNIMCLSTFALVH